MPIIYALGIGMLLLSMKHKIRDIWNVLVIVLIWLNIGALLFRLFPPLQPFLLRYWDKLFAPVAPIVQPILLFLQTLIINIYKILVGLGGN
ncbi:hypothetical protein [Desulfosporosinus shakirovi]|uniref:hypothetical protein n=1 Tax=Desulfosporosinus shakirovi TaxID=2885154 RepID=UPI001E308060|nr:hypothetical protein [Desulfosporosinus sp. SRJS8]MCB8818622.1 hypothetical protein [Desulfosporosinus sp. SRJS8]